MCAFYTIDFDYLKHLKSYDKQVPNYEYDEHDKFFFGVLITVNDKNYYVPVSSKKVKNATSMPIKEALDTKGNKSRILGSLRFAYMIPVDDADLTKLDLAWLRKTKGSNYTDLVDSEYTFCKNNLDRIRKRAETVYSFGTNSSSQFYNICCKFLELEKGLDEWLLKKNVTIEEEIETEK